MTYDHWKDETNIQSKVIEVSRMVKLGMMMVRRQEMRATTARETCVNMDAVARDLPRMGNARLFAKCGGMPPVAVSGDIQAKHPVHRTRR